MKIDNYSYFWKEQKLICVVQDEVFLLLKVGSKLTQRLFKSI